MSKWSCRNPACLFFWGSSGPAGHGATSEEQEQRCSWCASSAAHTGIEELVEIVNCDQRCPYGLFKKKTKQKTNKQTKETKQKSKTQSPLLPNRTVLGIRFLWLGVHYSDAVRLL